MPELLTYPWDSKYPDDNRTNFFGATAAYPNIPTDAVVTNGFGDTEDAGFYWQQSSGFTGSGGASAAYQRTYSNNNIQQGFSYERDSATGLFYPAWFDVGAGGGLSSGEILPEDGKSSFMNNVTSCWFLSTNNKSSTNASARTRYQIRQVAIRYINANNRRIVLKTCPTKLAGLTYNQDAFAGSNPYINGYELSESSKDIVELDGLLCIGFRIAIFISKDSSPLSHKTQMAVSAITPGFKDNTLTYNKDNKRIICRNSQTTYTEYRNETKFPVECR